MLSDPWSRPTLEDLRHIDENPRDVEKPRQPEVRRFPCCIPAELITRRGNSISAMTREIGPAGLSLVHKGWAFPGEARIRMASERDALVYRARVESCVPCTRGLYRSEITLEAEGHNPLSGP